MVALCRRYCDFQRLIHSVCCLVIFVSLSQIESSFEFITDFKNHCTCVIEHLKNPHV